mgnify:FL=1|jgi:toxin ParE1/3/4
MADYKISEEAKQDLRRIYKYGVLKFGVKQADKYFDSFFSNFDLIAQRPLSFESVSYIRRNYRRCPCDSDSIYYKINNGVVEIMAIVGSQDLEAIFNH